MGVEVYINGGKALQCRIHCRRTHGETNTNKGILRWVPIAAELHTLQDGLAIWGSTGECALDHRRRPSIVAARNGHMRSPIAPRWRKPLWMRPGCERPARRGLSHLPNDTEARLLLLVNTARATALLSSRTTPSRRCRACYGVSRHIAARTWGSCCVRCRQ